MDTISLAAAAVTGSRHLRAARNGQDATALVRTAGGGVVVVADGCGSGVGSEVGARLGARLYADALARRLDEDVTTQSTWEAARAEVIATLASIASTEDFVHECFLFTLVAAAVTPAGAAVWALGDGAYSFGAETYVLGPFADNQPPYVAYDLLGDRREATFVIAPDTTETIVVATDGACDLLERGEDLRRFMAPKLATHPDALRRELALLARSDERIDWDARRVVRVPAVLQDDCAIGVVHRRFAS